MKTFYLFAQLLDTENYLARSEDGREGFLFDMTAFQPLSEHVVRAAVIKYGYKMITERKVELEDVKEIGR